jgi:nitroreductase
METWDALTARRNVRRFDDRPLAPEDLERILEAGRRAPSAKNRQPWDFVVVDDRAQLGELATVWQGGGHVADSAATVALVLPVVEDTRRREVDHYDLGQATMAMMIAAADLGIGTGHSSVGDQDRAREILGLPADRYAAFLLDLGYPADRPLAPRRRPDRRPLDELVHRGRW